MKIGEGKIVIYSTSRLISNLETSKTKHFMCNLMHTVTKQLKKDLASSIDEHVITETELRHETNRLENEIQAMIEEYDREMFRR